MLASRRQLGTLGEKIAARYLRKNGYQIRETNFRCPLGEIDIVAWKDDCLVFVEVRAKRGAEFGTPEESVTAAKKQRLIDLADTYIQSHADCPAQWRIDVIAVEFSANGRLLRTELYENAVSLDKP